MPTQAVVAAFDVDGTLTRRDTLVPFLRLVCGRRAVARTLARRSARLVLSLATARHRGRDLVKETVLRDLLGGRPVEEVLAAGERFGDALATEAWLRPDTLARWRWHRKQGHELVIVSASLEVYLVPLARLLGGAHVLATRLRVDDGGRLTGELDGGNCRGPVKVARLREWGVRDGAELWAYGDSTGDRELLAAAGVPHRLRRGVRLPARPAVERLS